MTNKTALPKTVSWTSLALCLVITIAITVTITARQTRNTIQSEVSHYHAEHHAQNEKIVVLDLKAINQGFVERGADSRTALRGINALVSLFDREGYLIINADSTFAIPSRYAFYTDEYQNLIELAEEQGIDINDGVDDSVRAAEQFMQMLNSL